MLSKANIVSIIKANFADDRIFSAPLFVSKLLERKEFGSGIPRYRMTNKTTGVEITTEAQYLAALDAEDFVLNYPFDSEAQSSDRVNGFYVTVRNIEIRFTTYSQEDAFFGRFLDFGNHPERVYGVQMYLGYMNDGDTVLPVKLMYQRMYHLSN